MGRNGYKGEKSCCHPGVCVGAPDKVIPSEIGFSEGPRGHEAVPGEGPGCHGWM